MLSVSFFFWRQMLSVSKRSSPRKGSSIRNLTDRVCERPRPISAKTAQHSGRIRRENPGRAGSITRSHRTDSELNGDGQGGGAGRGSVEEVAIGWRRRGGRLWTASRGLSGGGPELGPAESFCGRSPSDGRCAGGRGGSALRRLRRAREDALRAVFPGQHPLDEMRKPHSSP